MSTAEQKNTVDILRRSTSNDFLKRVLIDIIDSYECFYKDKAEELEIKGNKAFREEMPSLVNPILTAIATKCETIVSEKSVWEEDQELLTEFSAYVLASEDLLEPTPYVRHVVDLILRNINMERKRELSNRVIWFLDDIYDSTWEALQLSKEMFHRIYFLDEKQ